MALYVKKLVVEDENRQNVLVLREVPIEKALKKMVVYVRAKDGDGVIKKVFRYLDEDFKKLMGFKDE